jgi:hypothetical protein
MDLFNVLLFHRLRYPSPCRFRRPKSSLGAMFILVRATEYVTSLESPLQRAVAMGAELLLGVVLLLGTTWIATHLAVRIFTPKESPSEGGPIV